MTKKIYFLKIFVLFIILFNHHSSIAQTSRMSGGKLTFIPNKTNEGLIFGSVTFPNKKALYNSYSFIFRYKNTDDRTTRKNSTSFTIRPKQLFKVEHGGELDEGLTYLFAFKLPEGEYELSKISFHANGGMMGIGFNFIDPIDKIQIKSVKGEINYVGNIVFDEYFLNNEDVIKHRDHFEKDLEAIKKEQLYIYWQAAKNNFIPVQ